MIGNNKLILCEAELIVAIQEYIDKRMKEYSPKVIGVSQDKIEDVFSIRLSAKDTPSDCSDS